jgi:hypothetical protein
VTQAISPKSRLAVLALWVFVMVAGALVVYVTMVRPVAFVYEAI